MLIESTIACVYAMMHNARQFPADHGFFYTVFVVNQFCKVSCRQSGSCRKIVLEASGNMEFCVNKLVVEFLFFLCSQNRNPYVLTEEINSLFNSQHRSVARNDILHFSESWNCTMVSSCLGL